MTTLSKACNEFADEFERLEPADADLAARLRGLVARLARDAAEHVADNRHGDVAAIVQRCQEALVALAAEAEDPEDRRCRHRRQVAVLNLLILADGVARFHAAKRKPADVAALRALVSDALRDLVADDNC